MRRKAFLILLGLGLMLAPQIAHAQSSITGVVRDTSGAVLPGVTVEQVPLLMSSPEATTALARAALDAAMAGPRGTDA